MHQFGSHLTTQYRRNHLSHEVLAVLLGSGIISPRQNKMVKNNSFRNRFLMQTMRQAQHATPASRRHTDTHKVHKSRFKHPREWTWLSTIPVRNPAGVDYSGNSHLT